MAGHRRPAALHFVRRQLSRHEHDRGGIAAQHRATAISRVLLTGGGTGGHVYPALAIAEVLRERSAVPPEFLFVGTRGGIEAQVVPRAGIPLAFVSSRPLARRVSLDLVRTAGANLFGVLQALGVIARFRPDCVVATGGYVSLPVVLAARLLRTARRLPTRIALVEPNAVPGLTNRLLMPLVDAVWHDAPVRASIVRPIARDDARRALGFAADRTMIVALGGSQGARRLNDAVLAAAREGRLLPEWQVLLISGSRDGARMADTRNGAVVRVVPYLDDPAIAYAAADIVVARAGASTLAELRATATPAILVPYPFATDDHQARNAEAVRSAGAARMVRDAELDAPRLARELTSALEPHALHALREAARRRAAVDSRERIFDRISALLAGG